MKGIVLAGGSGTRFDLGRTLPTGVACSPKTLCNADLYGWFVCGRLISSGLQNSQLKLLMGVFGDLHRFPHPPQPEGFVLGWCCVCSARTGDPVYLQLYDRTVRVECEFYCNAWPF